MINSQCVLIRIVAELCPARFISLVVRFCQVLHKLSSVMFGMEDGFEVANSKPYFRHTLWYI